MPWPQRNNASNCCKGFSLEKEIEDHMLERAIADHKVAALRAQLAALKEPEPEPAA